MKWPFSFSKKEVIPSGLVNPEDWLTSYFGGVVPGQVGVSAARALTVPAVQSAIKILSDATATLSVKVKRKEGTQETDAEDHPAWKLLKQDANPWTTSFELIRGIIVEALTNDEGGFAWVNRVNGKPVEIIKYGSGAIKASYHPDGSGEPVYTKNGKKLKPADVIHVRGAFHKSPLTLARTAIGFASALEDHGAQLFLSGARPGGVIETPKKLGDEGVKAMIKAWRLAYEGSANTGKTAILWDEATYKQLALTSTDAQYLENRKFQILEIARAFRVPPGMLYDLDRQTWSNGEQMGKEFLSYSLEPWLQALEGALSRSLLTTEERKTYRITFDRDDLTRADLTARASAISSLITAKVLNANEAREWLDLPPYSGGDVYENPAIQVAPENDNQPKEREAA